MSLLFLYPPVLGRLAETLIKDGSSNKKRQLQAGVFYGWRILAEFILLGLD